MDLRKLKKLIDLTQESGISELEVTEGEEKVRIVKYPASSPVGIPAPVYVSTQPAPVGMSSAIPISNTEDTSPELPPGHVLK
ncbi:MAG: acetyl-CoA carboxylase biotin carboxyl carrier protein, partial [Azoarcus sp.]|nr:acetyl-CoA carboxylase biotin carboxyl carrier protein [Azoarcus sp.]